MAVVLVLVPFLRHSPSSDAPPLASAPSVANLWLRFASLSPNLSVIGGVRLGDVEGGIVRIRRGVTTTANPPHHCDTVSISLPTKEERSGGITHDAFVRVRVVGADRVTGPLTHRQHLGKMLSMGSLHIGWSRRCVTSFMQ